MSDLTSRDKIELSDLRAEKSRAMLADAEHCLEAGMHGTSANRSYYAALHAARAEAGAFLHLLEPIRQVWRAELGNP